MEENNKEKEKSLVSILFKESVLSERVYLPFNTIGKNYEDIILQKIASKVEGKCISDGYIRRNSVVILNYSSGKVEHDMVLFEVSYSCQICLPVADMILECTAKSITARAGIHAQCIVDNKPVVSVFITRDDENLQHPLYATIKQDDKIRVRVIGVSFELNDETITVIANLLSPDE